MKKFLSALLVVLMLASLTVCAFAADSPSTDPDPGYTYVPAKTTNKLDEAKKAEAEAIKAIDDADADDDVVVGLGALPKDADDKTKDDFKDLEDTLVKAKDALASGGEGIIPASFKSEGKVAAGQPFRAVASSYPATITMVLDDPDSFVGMMIFQNGKWSELETTVNADGNVTFVLDGPSVLSIVSRVVKAA